MEMPRLNGSDLYAPLLEERPEIKVLVMSGTDIAEIVSQNIHMQFLPKPFDGKTVTKRVRDIFGFPPKPSKARLSSKKIGTILEPQPLQSSGRNVPMTPNDI